MEAEIVIQGGIYQIRNALDGKVYIGSSVNLLERFVTHRRDLVTNKHVNRYLQAAWNKYGEGAFTFEIIEVCESEILLEREQKAIETAAECVGWGMLYNLSRKAGAPMAGQKHAPEAIAKIKAAMKLPRKGRCKEWKHTKQWFDKRRGQKLSEEHKKRISLAGKGRVVSEETRKKIGNSHRGRSYPERCGHGNPMWGKHLSDETKSKLSAAMKGKPWTERRRNASKRNQLCLNLNSLA